MDSQWSVSDFIAVLNQTLEYAYPSAEVVGEISNFRVSKGKWVYFDLKDEGALLRCFTTVYVLQSGPLENGMLVKVSGSPKVHPLYNFTFTVDSITPVGEGALKRQADMLLKQLMSEGLFDESRKRPLPAIPRHIALVTAGQSAAYADFIKITKARWGGVVIDHYDVQVQGEVAPTQIVSALERISEQADVPEVVVIIRGGGSAQDLSTFNDERVVRAVAACRIPTLVAIGHEVDTALAELAADCRASTPSNAAELLFPDKKTEKRWIGTTRKQLDSELHKIIVQYKRELTVLLQSANAQLLQVFHSSERKITDYRRLLEALDPKRPLAMGFAIVRNNHGKILTSVGDTKIGDEITVELADDVLVTEVKNLHKKEK